MELVTLHTSNNSAPPVAKTDSKVYKRFQLPAIEGAIGHVEIAEEKKMEFFYIGKNPTKIDYIINTFKRGYAVENVEKAIAIIKRISEKDSSPDIIIVDGLLGESALIELHRFLSSNTIFSMVPLILDASEIKNEPELKKYTRLHFLDEIIFLGETNTQKLLMKVQFLKKIKRQPNKQQARKNVETSVDGITGRRFIGKRLFDILVSSLALVILSPVFLLIAIVIKIESRGPVFYIAQRAGRGYRIFNFFKFRTMVLDADQKVQQLSHLNQYDAKAENGPVFFKISNDPRITKVGAFLRNTSLDELPQLVNVLKGDMSLVGNRPLPLYEAATLTTDEWAARFLAPAGITGLWQIKKRGHNNMSVEERINLDIMYAHKYSFMYDLWIMANTPLALIQKSNV
jgi:lipopolysaccharide/colanic/teichoic acid biosynthesis glycosyltransferase